MPLRSWRGEGKPKFSHLAPTFAESYREAVQRHAEKKFAVFINAGGERRECTFAAFDEQVSRARALIRPERANAAIFALADQNSFENMVFACAAWLEGFSLCPVNPEEGAGRIKKKLGQLGEPCTFWAGARFAADLGARPLLIPEREGDAKAEEKSFAPEQPMVLIFTSGSTGVSKAVEQMESGILSNVDSLISRHGMAEPACVGTPLPLFHVNALEFSFLSTLLSGNTFVLFEKFKLGQILGAVKSERIHVLSLIPPMVRALCERKREVLGADLASLRYVVSAAAPLGPALARNFFESFPFRLLQGFGLSEGVNFSALMPRDLPAAEYKLWLTGFERPSIGTAIDGNEIFVLDEQGCELGPGERGEICIRGFNVMRGYRGDERRECFRGDYLHTGDLGHFEVSAGGEKFFFLSGRLKETIKRFGETVSLVEVDELLAEWAQGRGMDAIAVPFEHEQAGEELGVVMGGERDEAALLALKAYLEKLPKVIRPSVILWQAEAVRTPSGKPTRWKFKPAFERYRESIFGNSILTAKA